MDLPPSAFTRPPPPCAPPRPLRPSLLGVGDHARTRGRGEGLREERGGGCGRFSGLPSFSLLRTGWGSPTPLVKVGGRKP